MRIHANKFPRSSLVFKLHDAVNQSEQCIVFAATNIGTRFPFGPALTRENVAAEDLNLDRYATNLHPFYEP